MFRAFAALVRPRASSGLRLATLALLLATVPSCAALAPAVSVMPPEVRIADLEMLESNLFEQRFRVTLRVINPNDFALPLDGVRFALDLNDRPFARGVGSHGITVPRLGDATVTVDASTSTLDVLRQVLNASGRETLTYALNGTVFLAGHGRREVDFDQKGMLELLPSDAVRRLVPAEPGAIE